MIMYHHYAPYIRRFSNRDIDTQMDRIYSSQKRTKWCWAAAIQMALRYYGFSIPQEHLATDVCGLNSWGNAGNCPAYPEEITRSLSFCIDQDIYRYCVNAPINRGKPNIRLLMTELCNNQRPVIVAYRNPDGRSAHAILLTGCEWIEKNGRVHLDKLYARDPWLTSINRRRKGRVTINNDELRSFLNSIFAHWYVDIEKEYRYNHWVV